MDFQKLLFLYCQEPASGQPYEFVPYKFGAFSFTSYADRRKLIERGETDKQVTVTEPVAYRPSVRQLGAFMQKGSPRMHWLGWIVLVLAFIEAGWLAFDGGHALIVGDYVTPRSGQYAGQLGPWAKVVSAVGIEPRSTLMKSIHLGLGVGWLGVMVCFAMRIPWAWSGMIIGATLGLWYLPFGTLLSVIQIVLLLLPVLRESRT